MKAQLLGIGISILVHGAAMLLAIAAGAGLKPSLPTVALDFSFSSAGGSVGPERLPAASGAISSARKPAPLPNVTQANPKLSKSLLKEAREPPVVASLKKTSSKLVKPNAARCKIDKKVPKQKAAPDPPVDRSAAPMPADAPKPPSEVDDLLSAEAKPAAEPSPAGNDSAPEDASYPEGPNLPNEIPGGESLPVGSQAGGGGAEAPSFLAGGGNGSNTTSNGVDGYLAAHFSVIRTHLSEHLCYPITARKRGWYGKVLVSFIIHPDGHASNIKVHESCGFSLLDQSAVKTVRNASPFPFPPAAARIIVPILYQLE